MADNSEWCFVDVGDGYYQLRSRSSGMMIDVADEVTDDGGNIIQWPDNGEDNQQWRLEPL